MRSPPSLSRDRVESAYRVVLSAYQRVADMFEEAARGVSTPTVYRSDWTRWVLQLDRSVARERFILREERLSWVGGTLNPPIWCSSITNTLRRADFNRSMRNYWVSEWIFLITKIEFRVQQDRLYSSRLHYRASE